MSTVEEKIETARSRFVGGNLLALLWIASGTFACSLVNPIFGWLFLGFSAFSVYIIVRRLLCNSCYYCKSCTKGFAKLSILFLGANNIPGLSKGSIIGMTVYIYIVLMAIPSLVLGGSVLSQFTLLKLVGLVAVLAVSLYALTNKAKDRNRPLWKP